MKRLGSVDFLIVIIVVIVVVIVVVVNIVIKIRIFVTKMSAAFCHYIFFATIFN